MIGRYHGFASRCAGWLHDRFGWVTLNLAVLPLLMLAFAWSAAGNRARALPSAAT